MTATPNHLLHAKLGSEGFWSYRLECVGAAENHYSYSEKREGCTCTCEYCQDGDHGGCTESEINYVDGVGYGCFCERDPQCWVHDWLDNVGGELIEGDDWPEDSLPLPVDCRWSGDGMVIKYAGDGPA